MVNNTYINKSRKVTPTFFIALLCFIIVILGAIYMIYLRYIPYTTIEYDGYAVSGKDIAKNLLNANFDVNNSVKALKVSDQDDIYQNVNSYYVGASKQDNINLNYPIYINGSLALYNLSSDVTLITDDFQEVPGYSGITLTSGALYNSNTLQRADYYDYILMKNSDNLYINTKALKIKTSLNEYTIPMNGIINFTNSFITYYSLENEEFVYNKILDIDDNSIIIVEDYNKQYTYREFLLGLKIISENNLNNKGDKENTENVVNTEDTNQITSNVINEENLTNTETIPEEPIEEEPGNSEDKPTEIKWIKPTVTCDDFVANVYSAYTQVNITDPSRVIYKAVTFTFYKDGEIAFRYSTTTSGTLNITKLLPNTKYTIVGTFQYRTKAGNLMENTIIEQEITTKGVENLNPINLSFENGQIYSNKMELKNLQIVSSIEDEAIKGVSKAEIVINGTKYTVNSNTLRSLLKGEAVTYQSADGLKSNTKCDYEIKFYDTAGNEMDLKNNKGSTVTSKKSPSVKIKVSAQEIISVTVEPTIVNEDNVALSNYRYVLYSSTGEIVSKGNMSNKNNPLIFNNLDPQNTYTIKVYADFDIEDGKGMLYDQEIGNATFTTLPLSKLGSLKLNVTYDENTDLTCNSINLTTAINTSKTDSRLIKILKSVKINIQNLNGNSVKEINITDISTLATEEGIKSLIDHLNSNTTYNIVITATALQGNTEEEITTSYTLTKFLTNKLPARLNVINTIVTEELIDMDIYIDDIDHACIDDIVIIRLYDSYGKEYLPTIEPSTIKSNTKIPTNQWVRLTYSGLNKDETYELSAEVASYNETNDSSKIQNNFKINSVKFITSGLGGTIDLTGLGREMNENGSNLIDVKSENNWYSQCFDSITTGYTLDESYNAQFIIDAKYNYGKTYTEDGNNITVRLLSNQCYVYDFSEYAGQTVTMSFSAKVTEANAKIYMQKGKQIGKNIEELTGLTTNNYVTFQKTVTVPEDGYLGFYLEQYVRKYTEVDEETDEEIEKEEVVDYYLDVKNLKVELGRTATEYKPYEYDLYSNVNVSFIDKNHATYDKNEQRCKYYVRLTSSKGEVKEYDYTYDSYENVENLYKYKIEESNEEVDYTFELIIKQNNREYVLSTATFTYVPEECTEIKSITTAEEFKEIQPYGNYILLNDIDLTNETTPSEYTFGNPNISFYGTIDFNGKTIKKNTYSIAREEENTSYIFYKLENTATLKNVVIDYYINNTKNRFTTNVEGMDVLIAKEDGIYSLFLYNDAKIDNIIVNLKGCTKKQRINVGLIGYRNAGTIENFIVNYETTLYGSQYLAGTCLYSTGVIQNGYLYGKGIEAIGDITIGDYRYIAGVLFQIEEAGILQNVYNVSKVIMNHSDSTYSYGANIVYNVGYPPIRDEITGAIISTKDSTAIVRNIYSVESLVTIYNGYEHYGVLDSNNKEGEIGPNILYKYTSTKAYESYYFCDVNYEVNDYNTKTSATGLYEPGVQDVMLNANGYNQFTIDMYVNNGYYPHLNLNYCMPKQDNVRIEATGNEIIDVLSGQVVENNDISTLEISDKVKTEIESFIRVNNIDITAEDQVIAEFRVYNPAGTTISEINMNYLNATIMSQTYSKKISTVYVLLNTPTSYLDIYTVASIRSRMANGKIKESIYGENEALGIRTIEVTFIKNISTAQEWNSINNADENGVSGLIQNYRLVADIDFANADFAPYITGTFEGYLDGEYEGKIHTLKNIEGTQSLIKGFTKGTIKNLCIENFVINTSSQYAGFIEKADASENITIDNIHIKDMEISSSYSGSQPYIGGICAYVNSGSASLADKVTIQNCSIQGLNIEFTNTSVTNIIVGGIAGYLYIFGGVDANINNCYVQNMLINADVTSNTGVGGILGYESIGTDERVKLGTPYVYIRNCFTTGKINTKMYAGGILGYGRYGNTYVQKCYSLVNMNSKITSGNVYMGGIVGYSETNVSYISNNFYLGNIYVAGNSVGYVNRIFGGNAGTSSYKNYAYKDQLMSGEVLTSSLGATKLLSYEEAFQMNTYSNLLGFDNNYAYSVTMENGETLNLLEAEYLPALNDTNGNLLMYQKYNALDNDLKLDSIKSTPSADKTEVTVVMKFENPNNLNLIDAKIENNDMQIKEGSWQTSKEESTGLTVVTFVATPNRAYDSYKIESVYYERNGQTTEKEISTKIKVELYKGISNAKEWNDFFAADGRTYEGQNVKITGDIDFSTVSTIESNVIIGRLEADEVKTISNVKLSSLGSSSGFVKEIKTSFKNLNFKDCTINGKGSYIGLIGIVRGATSNCNFTNIQIDCTGNYDYIGIISRCIAGSLNNITLNNVTVKGRSNVGGLCGQTSSLGSSSNIHGTYLCITATGDNVGGLFGYTVGNIANISAYQYSASGRQSGDAETSWLAKGNNQVGGCIGNYSAGGQGTVNVINNTYSKVQGAGNVGANIGYASGYVYSATSTNNVIVGTTNNAGGNEGYHGGWTAYNFNSSNNTITGNNRVGGNLGGTGWTSNDTFKSTNNTIKGAYYTAGCIGFNDHSYASIYNLKASGSNQTVTGTYYVGGVIGRAYGRVKNVQAQDFSVIGTGNYVGGIMGSEEYVTTSISSSNNSNYSLAGANAKNMTIIGSAGYVGGIVGWTAGTIYGCVTEQCTITASGNNAGGIAGYYIGYSGGSASAISSSNYFLWHSICKDSTVQAANNAGGLVGNFVYGNIQYCYVANTSVTAKTNGAGGLVGYFDNSRLSNLQYKATIKYNFIANIEIDKVVKAANSVGGLIGITAKQLNYDEEVEKYNNVECNLVVTDLSSTGSYIDIGIGSVTNSSPGILQSQYMNNIYAYNCSYINDNQVGGLLEEVTSYKLLSSSELSNSAIFTKNDKITDEEGKTIGNDGLNFGKSRYDYSNGYFPTLKTSYSAELYWGSSNLNIVQNKIAIPTRDELFTSAQVMSLRNTALSVAAFSLEDEEVPDVYVYASDIDKINIEFENIDANTKFVVNAGDNIIIEKTPVTEQVYTIQYDYKTPLKITVSNADYWYTEEVTTDSVQNLLTIVEDEYFYIADTALHSNKRDIDGEFVNIYENKALDSDGKIYNISTMDCLSNGNIEVKLLDSQKPIAQAEYNNVTIQTFAHCSKVIQDENNYAYKAQQMFVKNGSMYVIDGTLNSKENAIIIDSYNNKQYESVLGTDGMIYDLLTEINYPANFKNENIVAMTSNVSTNDNVVLVYYSSGKVYGFNYITGDEVYDNNVKGETISLATYMLSSLSLDNVAYNIEQSDYKAAQELAAKLEKISVDEAIEEISSDNTEVNNVVVDNIDNNSTSTEIDINNNTTNTNSISGNTNSGNTSNENTTNSSTNNSTTSGTNSSVNSNTAETTNEYITTYDAGTQSYVVYSTSELLKMSTSKTQTENDKINGNAELISYYQNVSTSTQKAKNVGIVVIALIVASICVILVVLYKRNK